VADAHPGLTGFLQTLHDAPKEALHDETLLQTTMLHFGIFRSMPTPGVFLPRSAPRRVPAGCPQPW
jgi:hypothetical protein